MHLLIFLLVGSAFGLQQPQFDYEYEYEEVPVRVTPSRPDNRYKSYESNPSVFIPEQGRIDGARYAMPSSGRTIEQYLGIKYGYVGKGAARFQVAGPPKPYTPYAHDGSKEPLGCPSFPELRNLTANERENIPIDDCLTLSVFTANTRGRYPVMVYIHGEFFFDGSAEEAKPDYLMREDGIVLVSVNYRLAPFGFISTLTNEIPGNVALSDIKMALEWVQRNIYLFGGDSRNVTVFGQSAGAGLIHALALSQKAVGTFNRVILQSGTAMNPFYIDESPYAHAQDIARRANCPRFFSPYDINRCLAQLSTSDIIKAFVSHCEENELKGLVHWGGAKIAIGDKLGFITNKTLFMNEEDFGASRTHKRFDVSVMGGVVKHAGAYFISRIYTRLQQAQPRNNISTYIDAVLNYTAQPIYHKSWKELALRRIFTAEQIRSGNFHDLTFGLIELVNLILFKAPLLEAVKYSRPNEVYLYNFEYRGQYRRYPFDRRQFAFDVGASLSDENTYLFPFPVEVSNLNPNDAKMSNSLSTMWRNFARTGKPYLEGAYWPQMDQKFGPYLKIGERFELDGHFTDGNVYPDFYDVAVNWGKPKFNSTVNATASSKIVPVDRMRSIYGLTKLTHKIIK